MNNVNKTTLHSLPFYWRAVKLLYWRDFIPHREGKKLYNTYTILRHLGTGGFAHVYVCEHHETKKHVLIKQLKRFPYIVKQNANPHQEAILLKEYANPHVPYFFETFREKRYTYHCLEWIQGNTLHELLFDQSQSFSEVDVLRVATNVLNEMNSLFSFGLVHGDIRLQNMVSTSEGIRFIDFGLAHEIKKCDNKEHVLIVQHDLFMLGQLMLFLLYSTFEQREDQVECSWEEELSLSPFTHSFLRRLLKMDTPFQTFQEALHFIYAVKKAHPL